MDREMYSPRAFARLFVLALPLLLLIAAIMITQTYVAPSIPDPPPGQDLQLIGYGNNGAVLTVSNIGDKQLTILTVAFDGRILAQGNIGGAMPMFSMPNGSQSGSICTLPTDSLVLPKGEHWNMDTGGLCAPTIPPAGVASLYLGVFSAKPQHVIVIHTHTGDYVFRIGSSSQ